MTWRPNWGGDASGGEPLPGRIAHIIPARAVTRAGRRGSCWEFDRICRAVNRMNVGGYRTVPFVGAQRRPVGIVTSNDVTRWLAEIFPGAILNLRPGDRIKRPADVDAG